MNILPVWCLALEILDRNFYFMGFQSVYCVVYGVHVRMFLIINMKVSRSFGDYFYV